MLTTDVVTRSLDETSPNLPEVQQEAVWMDKTTQTSSGVTAELLARNTLHGHWSCHCLGEAQAWSSLWPLITLQHCPQASKI